MNSSDDTWSEHHADPKYEAYCSGTNTSALQEIASSTPAPTRPVSSCPNASASESRACSLGGGACRVIGTDVSPCPAGHVTLNSECGASCECCMPVAVAGYRNVVAFDIEVSMTTWSSTPQGFT